MRECRGWRWLAAVTMLAAGCCCGAGDPLAPSVSMPAMTEADLLPLTIQERFVLVEPPLSRDEFVRRVVREHLSLLSEQAFDVMGVLAPAGGTPGALARGTKLGLVTGSVGYVSGVLGGADPWLVGTAGLALGFGVGALTDVNWPNGFTVKWTQDESVSFGMGWLRKPGYLPQSRARLGGPPSHNRYTAGVGLHLSPRTERDLDIDLFLDPFAPEGDSCGGLQIAFGF